MSELCKVGNYLQLPERVHSTWKIVEIIPQHLMPYAKDPHDIIFKAVPIKIGDIDLDDRQGRVLMQLFSINQLRVSGEFHSFEESM